RTLPAPPHHAPARSAPASADGAGVPATPTCAGPRNAAHLPPPPAARTALFRRPAAPRQSRRPAPHTAPPPAPPAEPPPRPSAPAPAGPCPAVPARSLSAARREETSRETLRLPRDESATRSSAYVDAPEPLPGPRARPAPELRRN